MNPLAGGNRSRAGPGRRSARREFTFVRSWSATVDFPGGLPRGRLTDAGLFWLFPLERRARYLQQLCSRPARIDSICGCSTPGGLRGWTCARSLGLRPAGTLRARQASVGYGTSDRPTIPFYRDSDYTLLGFGASLAAASRLSALPRLQASSRRLPPTASVSRNCPRREGERREWGVAEWRLLSP